MTSVHPVHEEQLLHSLRQGDEDAFAMLVDEHGPAMLRVALMYVRSRAVAEEVVQETWLGVLRGIERFEGRSSLRTWIFRILANVAKTRAVRESRSLPFSSLAHEELEGPSVRRSASARRVTGGPLTGRAPRRNGPCRKSAFSPPKRGTRSPTRLQACLRPSGRWSRFATSRAGAPKRFVTFSSFPRRINECFFTVLERGSDRHSTTT